MLNPPFATFKNIILFLSYSFMGCWEGENVTRALLLMVLMVLFSVAVAGWWDDDWEHRQQVTVTEQADHNLSFYPVVVEDVDIGNASWESVRVIDASTMQLIDFGLNQSGKTIDVAFQVNLSARESRKLSIYYGREGADPVNVSWETARYNFYDGFENDPLENGWTEEYDCSSINSEDNTLVMDSGNFNACTMYQTIPEVGTTALAEIHGYVAEKNGGFRDRLNLFIKSTSDRSQEYQHRWERDDYPLNFLLAKDNDNHEKHEKDRYNSTEPRTMFLGYNGTHQFAGLDADRFLTVNFTPSEGERIYIGAGSALIEADWISYRNYVEPEPQVSVGEEQGQENSLEEIVLEDVIVVSKKSELALPISLGVETVQMSGGTELQEALERAKSVFELESDVTEYPSVSRKEVLQRGNSGDVMDIGCPRDVVKRSYLGMVASLNDSQVVCSTGEYVEVERSVEALQEEYVASVRERGEDINHVVVASRDVAPVAASVAADKGAFLQVVNASGYAYEGVEDVAVRNVENGVPDVEDAVMDAAELLASHGMYRNGSAQYVDGLYLSLFDVPSVLKADPVDQAGWGVSDADDYFMSDLAYGDLTGDDRLDVAVGRYPDDPSLASHVYLRSKYYEDNKQALVASQYLHTNWPVILAYLGGGMWSGKSMEHILDDRGYDVTRSVEHRADPAGFLVDLTPASLEAALGDADDVEEQVGAVLGDSIGAAAAKVTVYVRALEYVQQGLENYLEFDWSTFGFDAERSMDRLAEKDIDELYDLENVTKEAAQRAMEQNGTKESVVAALDDEDVQEWIAEAVYVFLWPDRYDRMTEEDLTAKIPDSSIVYYTGVGNGSAWHLPNEYDYHTPLEKVKTGRYNGTNNVMAGEIPANTARIVFDNSDHAARQSVSRQQLWRGFLEQGSASFIGTSSVNYAQYASEIDTQFFQHGYTAGESMRQAVNAFSDSWLTWDPFNELARDGVKQKMLRSFQLYGNPEMIKDPVIEDDIYTLEQDCDGMNCTMTIDIDLNYSVEEADGTRMIDVEANSQLLESFQPLLPLITAEHTLPSSTTVYGHDLEQETRTVDNVTVPELQPLSQGGTVLNDTTLNASDTNASTAWFPANVSRFDIDELHDDRLDLQLVQAAYRYNESAQTAEVYENVTLTLNYSAPFQLSVDAADGMAGKEQDIRVHLQNHLGHDVEGSILLKIGNATKYTTKELHRNFTKDAETIVTESFTPPTAERYGVDAYFVSDEYVLGPWDTMFEVGNLTALKQDVVINEVLPAPAGDKKEFVELYNPTDTAVPLEHLELYEQHDREYDLSGMLPADGYRVFTFNTMLNRDGDALTLDYCPPDTVVDRFAWDDGTKDVMWTYEDGAFHETEPTLDHNHAFTDDTLRIVSVLPLSDDEWGDDGGREFVIVYNPTNSTVDLDRYVLQDRLERDRDLTGVIAPNETVTLFDTNWLRTSGDTVELVKTLSCTQVDQLEYVDAEENVSLGRSPDGTDTIRAMPPTSGEQNWEPAPADVREQIVINEVYPAGLDEEEFVEVYNPTTQYVDLFGFEIRDAADRSVRIDGMIEPRGHHVVEPPRLNNDGDTVDLLFDDELIDTFTFDAREDGESFGRSPDGTGEFELLPPTPEEQNPVIEEQVVEKEVEVMPDNIPTGLVTAVNRTQGSPAGNESTGTTEGQGDTQLPVDVPGTVYTGVPFDTELNISNVSQYDEVYSYAFNGSQPLTKSMDGQKHWTANRKDVTRSDITLTSVMRDDVTGSYPYRVRLTGEDQEDEYTTTINVTAPPNISVEHTVTGDTVLVNLSAPCQCDAVITPPGSEQNITVTLNATNVTIDRVPGSHTVSLTNDGAVLNTVAFEVPGNYEIPGEQRSPQQMQEQPGQITGGEQPAAPGPTGAISSDVPGSVVSWVSGVADTLLFWR